MTSEVFTTHGLPLAIYGDRLNVFVRNDRHWTLEEQLAGERHPTHLGRMFQDLGISYISAHSPQAKGRIERLWATLQDRLPSELRLPQPSPGPDFVLTPRRSPSSERQGRRQRHATAMRKALTDLARAEKKGPAGPTTEVTPAEARAEPAGGATTHDRQGGRDADTPTHARNSPRAQWRPAPSHPWRRAVTSAVAAKNRRKPIPPGG